jgi:hypothetical protein
VVQILHSHITEAFSKLEVDPPQTLDKEQVHHLVYAFRLPRKTKRSRLLHSHFLKTSFFFLYIFNLYAFSVTQIITRCLGYSSRRLQNLLIIYTDIEKENWK